MAKGNNANRDGKKKGAAGKPAAGKKSSGPEVSPKGKNTKKK